LVSQEKTKKRSKPAGSGSKISAGELRKALHKGKAYGRSGDWYKALPHLLKAWDAMPEDVNILTLLSQALVATGVRDKAIEVLERTLAIHGETPDILSVMVNLATEMEMYEVAAKLGFMLVEIQPQNPARYVNLASALGGLGEYDHSISILQDVLPIFPDNADLWNVLACHVRARDGYEHSVVFYEQALSLGGKDYKILTNFAQTLTVLGQQERALELYRKAVKVYPKSPETNLGIGKLLFQKGDMEKAFEYYEYRQDKRRASNQVQHYTHGVKRWEGESLEGKSLLIEAEQGIGDEVMWCSYLPFLYERAEQLYISCNVRLVSIFQRCFPKAVVCGFIDRFHQGYRYRIFPEIQQKLEKGEITIDYAIPMASSPRYDWKTLEDVKPHPDGYLSPLEDLKADMKARLDAISDRPKVGIAWTSGVINWDRAYHYAPIEKLGALFEYKDQVDFVNVQYGDVTADVAKMKELFDVEIHQIEGVDLKMDIEANLAIMSSMEMVLSSGSAPGQFALATGTPTLIMSGPRLWWGFGGAKKIAYAQDGEIFDGDGKFDWDDIIGRMAARMAERLNLKPAS